MVGATAALGLLTRPRRGALASRAPRYHAGAPLITCVSPPRKPSRSSCSSRESRASSSSRKRCASWDIPADEQRQPRLPGSGAGVRSGPGTPGAPVRWTHPIATRPTSSSLREPASRPQVRDMRYPLLDRQFRRCCGLGSKRAIAWSAAASPGEVSHRGAAKLRFLGSGGFVLGSIGVIARRRPLTSPVIDVELPLSPAAADSLDSHR